MNPMISYAQNGEDVILRRIFENQKTGFYIDIGASHPEFLSVTKHFYDQGWNGINVEPLKKNIELFAKERPRDLNLNLAIASEKGSRDFFEVIGYPELSTLSAAHLLGYEHNAISYPVEVITGNKLFSDYAVDSVDFMKIDVEGAEYEVINSIDFLRYRPKVLVIEATIPNSIFPGWGDFKSVFSFAEWEPVLLSSGYIFAYFDGLNRFYVREENKNFLDYFQFGLSLWDNFVTYSQFKLIADLEWNCVERMKSIETLTERLKESEADRAERMKSIETLTERLKESEADRAARLIQRRTWVRFKFPGVGK